MYSQRSWTRVGYLPWKLTLDIEIRRIELVQCDTAACSRRQVGQGVIEGETRAGDEGEGAGGDGASAHELPHNWVLHAQEGVEQGVPVQLFHI